MFYFLLTNAIYPGHAQGSEGKVMGMAPYGDPHAFDLPPLEVHGAQVRIPDAWQTILREKRFRWSNVDGERRKFEEVANLAAAGQRAFEDAVLEVARWLYGRTGAKDLCFAGGTALNVSTNDRLIRETPFERVFIPPAPSDAGTSLGCAMYGVAELLGRPVDYRWNNDFLGPEPERAAIDAALRDVPDLVVSTPDDLVGTVVDLLVQTKVIGLYQGRSEFGPRALGHRSIIADPRPPFMRDWINANVKGREWFRPLAPIVLLEHASAFFDMRRPSPYMQFAAPVHGDAAEKIPAVTHVDGTARLQTVGPDDDAFVRALLERFQARTGIPVLLNTSFNGKDEPIVETPHEAVASFLRTPMHALVIPPYLVRKRVEPEPPA
jgi:carbamoyltransferase